MSEYKLSFNVTHKHALFNYLQPCAGVVQLPLDSGAGRRPAVHLGPGAAPDPADRVRQRVGQHPQQHRGRGGERGEVPAER